MHRAGFCLGLRLDLFLRHNLIRIIIVGVCSQVTLGEDQGNGLRRLDVLDLKLPFTDTLEGRRLIGGDANEEDIRILVLHLTVDAKMFVTRCVVDLDLYLLLLDVLDALVDVQDGWLVILRKCVMEIIRDEA